MVQWSKFARVGYTPDLRTRWGQSVIIKSSIAGSLLKYLVGSLMIWYKLFCVKIFESLFVYEVGSN